MADELDRPGDEPCLFVEVVAGPELLGIYSLKRSGLKTSDHKFTFDVSKKIAEGIGAIETRIGVLSPIGIAIQALTVEPAAAPIVADDKVAAALTIADLLRIDNWLPFLRLGPLGRVDELGAQAETGAAAFVAYGLDWSLPAGMYEMIVRVEPSGEAATPEHLIKADVVQGDRPLVAVTFSPVALANDDELAPMLVRLPFELDGQAPEQRQIQPRIWSSGEDRFCIRSLSVKPLERQPQPPRDLSPEHQQREDLLPLLGIGEVGRRVAEGIGNLDKRIGFVAYSQTIAVEPGAYRLALQVTVEPDGNTPLPNGRTCMMALVKRHYDILAAATITSGADQNENDELTFEIPSDPAGIPGFEFLLQLVAPAKITLRTLTLERANLAIRETDPAICTLENWLPFLKTTPSAKADAEGVVVAEGRADYAVYGPYWTLPAGRYELVAAIVPPAPNPDGKPVITVDVTADHGHYQLAGCHCRLGQFESGDPHTAVEFRLPFTLAADLSPELRTIERAFLRRATLVSAFVHWRCGSAQMNWSATGFAT